MRKLIDYLNLMSADQQRAFALTCETTVGYLRKAASTGQNLGEGLVMRIERASARAVTCEDLRPDVDWAYLRGTAATPEPHEKAA